MTLRQFFSNKESWSQGSAMRDSNGFVTSRSYESTSMCLGAAIDLCYRRNRRRRLEIKKIALAKVEQAGYNSITEFNDSPLTEFKDIRAICRELEKKVAA